MGKRSKHRRPQPSSPEGAAPSGALPATPTAAPEPAPGINPAPEPAPAVSLAETEPAPEPIADLTGSDPETVPAPDEVEATNEDSDDADPFANDEDNDSDPFEDAPVPSDVPETLLIRGGLTSVGPVRVLAGARITGDVTARELVVGGTVEGDAVAQESIVLQTGGHVGGTLTGYALQIEEGARFKGRVRIGLEHPAPRSTPPGEDESEDATSATRKSGRNWWFKEGAQSA